MPDYNLKWTARSSAIQGDKGVNVAACSPESSPAKAESLSTSSLPLISTPHLARMPDDPAKKLVIGEFFKCFNVRVT